MDKMALRPVFPPVILFSPVSNSPPILDPHSSIPGTAIEGVFNTYTIKIVFFIWLDTILVFLNRRAAARYRALASIIPGREKLRPRTPK
jgi:hypothetical protein